MKTGITFEDFVEKARLVHGDKYDYDESSYKSCKDFIKMVCREHDYQFCQRGFAHLRGQNCPLCGTQAALETRRRNKQEDLINKVENKFPNKFDLRNLYFKDVNTDVTAVCDRHGELSVNPRSLVRHGCSLCNKEDKQKFYLDKLKEEVESRLHLSHLDLSYAKYVNNSTRIKVKCKRHNKIFYQTPNKILDTSRSKRIGCEDCRKILSNRWSIKAIKCIPENETLPCYVYIGTINKIEGYKIGITKNLHHRKGVYDRDMEDKDLTFNYLYTFKSNLLNSALIEAVIQKVYHKYHVRHEYDFGGKTEIYNLPNLKLIEDIFSGRFDMELEYLARNCGTVSNKTFKAFVSFLKRKYNIE